MYDGPQTPKTDQPALDLWIPLLFWFNKDPRLAIPSVSIPYGQRFIDVEFAAANQILQHVGLTPADDNPGANPPPVPDVQLAELWINNIFVNPEIHDIFIKRIGFTLIRVHRIQSIRVNKASDQLLLNQMKWPIETLYIGLRPTDNVDYRNSKMLTSWNVYAETQKREVALCALDEAGFIADARLLAGLTNAQLTDAILAAALVPNAGPLFDAGDFAGVTLADINAALSGSVASRQYQSPNPNPPPAFFNVPVQVLKEYDAALFADANAPTGDELIANAPANHCMMEYEICIPTLRDIQIQAHGVNLYQTTPATFFNAYVPYTYGGHHVNTPVDCGKLMVTFNLYPASYQPSGHVNISRAREFYLNYNSNQVGDSIATSDMVVIGVAVNFLLILTLMLLQQLTSGMKQQAAIIDARKTIIGKQCNSSQ